MTDHEILLQEVYKKRLSVVYILWGQREKLGVVPKP